MGWLEDMNDWDAAIAKLASTIDSRQIEDMGDALIEQCDQYDPEVSHSRADEVLCAMLRAHGHGDVVEKFEALRKWYA